MTPHIRLVHPTQLDSTDPIGLLYGTKKPHLLKGEGRGGNATKSKFWLQDLTQSLVGPYLYRN